jgi:5-methyltetrahydropteroyltriglutamate--homocysteine methyltransferase
MTAATNRAVDLRTVRVDQVGSLVAPLWLHDLLERNTAGEVSDEELQRAQDDVIRETIGREEAVGLPVVTDGELRRRNFQDSFGAAVSGFATAADLKQSYIDRQRTVATEGFRRAEADAARPGPAIANRLPVRERLTLAHNVVLDEYVAAAKVATRPLKVTLMSADRIAQRFAHEHELSKGVYPDVDAFLADVVAISREMIRQLVDAGCRYIQIDAPGYTAYSDAVSLERMRSRGEDPHENMTRAIAADNAIVAGFDDVVFGIHLCRGNPRTTDAKTGKILAQWHREGHYDAYAEQLFSTLAHDRLLLEYDSERAGGFAPLRFVQKGKVVVLGLVTTKDEEIEDGALLERRIAEAAQVLPLEQLALSPQCGFGGLGQRHSLSADVQWWKFARIVETAQRVWN